MEWSYSEGRRSVPCKLEDYLKIDFHDWMTIRVLNCYLLPFYQLSKKKRLAFERLLFPEYISNYIL